MRQNSFFNQSSRVLFYRPSIESVPIGNITSSCAQGKQRLNTIIIEYCLSIAETLAIRKRLDFFMRLRNRAGTVSILLKRSPQRNFTGNCGDNFAQNAETLQNIRSNYISSNYDLHTLSKKCQREYIWRNAGNDVNSIARSNGKWSKIHLFY